MTIMRNKETGMPDKRISECTDFELLEHYASRATTKGVLEDLHKFVLLDADCYADYHGNKDAYVRALRWAADRLGVINKFLEDK